VPKIISGRCELIKLCHINRIGPGFFLTHSVAVLAVAVNWYR